MDDRKGCAGFGFDWIWWVIIIIIIICIICPSGFGSFGFGCKN